MQIDEDFNIRFVTIVKRYRCLYDKKVPEYRNKDFQEKSWQEIAQETKESVLHCKERWRNLRACLSRYIKQQNGTDPQHKPYYLTEHMAFLLPYLKTSRSLGYNAMTMVNFAGGNFGSFNTARCLDALKQSTSDLEDETTKDTFENKKRSTKTRLSAPHPDEMSDTDSTDSINYMPDVQVDLQTPTSSEVIFPAGGGSVIAEETMQNAKRIKTEPIGLNGNGPDPFPSNEHSDMEFFRSILPDISGMNALQKRKFKIGILELIDDVYEKYPTMSDRGSRAKLDQLNGYNWRK